MKTKMVDISRWDVKVLTVDAFKTGDVDELKTEGVEFLDENMIRLADRFGPARTVRTPEGILFTGGIIESHEGVGTAWMAPTDLISKYSRETYFYARAIYDEILSKMSLRAVYAYVATDDKASIRFAGRLGFNLCGRLGNWSTAGDYYLMWQEI
jgi:hypothetical protein